MYVKIESLQFKVNTLGSIKWCFILLCDCCWPIPGQLLVIVLWCHIITLFYFPSILVVKKWQSSIWIWILLLSMWKIWTMKEPVIWQSFQGKRKTKKWFRDFFVTMLSCLNYLFSEFAIFIFTSFLYKDLLYDDRISVSHTFNTTHECYIMEIYYACVKMIVIYSLNEM